MALTFHVDINRQFNYKVPKYSSKFRELNMTFKTERLDTAGLFDAVRQGYAFVAQHKKVQHLKPNGKKTTYRVKQNVIDVQVIGLDTEKNELATLDAWRADTLFSQFGAFAYTTPSHKPDEPHTRAVFVLSEPVDVATAEAGLQALMSRYPHLDKSCSDASRLFYGSKNCEFIYLGNVLPVDVLRSEIDAYQGKLDAAQRERVAARQARQTTKKEANAGGVARYMLSTKDRILADVGSAPEGSRHITLRDAAVRLGSLSVAEWADSDARAILDGAEDELATAAGWWCHGSDDEREVERIIRDGLDFGQARPAWEPTWKERTSHATPREPEAPDGESLVRELERARLRESIQRSREFFREVYPGGEPALAYEDKRIRKLGNPTKFITSFAKHVENPDRKRVALHPRPRARRDSLSQLKKDAWRLAKQIEEEQADGRVFYLATLPSEADWRRVRDAWRKKKERGRAIAWQVYRQDDKTVIVIHDDAQRAGELLPTEFEKLNDLTRHLLLGMPEDDAKRVRTSLAFGGNYTGSRGDGRKKRAKEWDTFASYETEGDGGIYGAAAATGIELNNNRYGAREMEPEDYILSTYEAGYTYSPLKGSPGIQDLLTGQEEELSHLTSNKELRMDTKCDIPATPEEEDSDATLTAFALPTMTDAEPAEMEFLDWFLETENARRY